MKCAVEGCPRLGACPRVFPHYRITLCLGHWIEALINHHAREVAP